MTYTLAIIHNNVIQYPPVKDGVTWETERKGSPGKLTFEVMKTYDGLNIQEGDPVTFVSSTKNIFFGFVFSKSRSSDGSISITAYDQLRYLKNKHTYVYTNLTTGALVKKICNDFELKWGDISDTKFPVSRTEEEQSLFDIIQNSLDDTIVGTKEMYVLYDDYGKLALKNISEMKTNLLINDQSARDYRYDSSIDGETYNRVVVYDEKGNAKMVWDDKSMNEWGVLQMMKKTDNWSDAGTLANSLLNLYNSKTRNLTITDAFGDENVRGGSLVIVDLALGDTTLRNYMIVEKATHKFKNDNYTMDLVLRGGEFTA